MVLDHPSKQIRPSKDVRLRHQPDEPIEPDLLPQASASAKPVATWSCQSQLESHRQCRHRLVQAVADQHLSYRPLQKLPEATKVGFRPRGRKLRLAERFHKPALALAPGSVSLPPSGLVSVLALALSNRSKPDPGIKRWLITSRLCALGQCKSVNCHNGPNTHFSFIFSPST